MQQSSMQQQQQHRPRRRSNVDQAITIQQLLGVNTSSSRSHPLVISNALKALKSCNDQAFLTAMLSKKEKEHTAKLAKHSNSNSVALPHHQQESSYQVQSRVHAAMQAQLRQLEEYSNEHYSYSRTKMTSTLAAATQQGGVTPGSGSGTGGMLSSAGVENPVHAAMLAQMRQLEESKHQRLIAGVTKATSTQMSSSNTMSQGNVAQLYNEMNVMRQQQHLHDSGVSSSVANNNASPPGAGESRSQRKRSMSVRRASAA